MTDQMTTIDTPLAGALDVAACGWAVFPLRGDGTKRPAHKGWQSESTTDTDTIRGWASEGLQFAIDTEKSGLLVLDEDRLGDFDAWRTDAVPETRIHGTGRDGGGRHHLYQLPEGVVYRSSNAKFKAAGLNIDVKCRGGYIVAPGAVHVKTGTRYHVLNDVDPVELPEEVAERWLKRVGDEPNITVDGLGSKPGFIASEEPRPGPLPEAAVRWLRKVVDDEESQLRESWEWPDVGDGGWRQVTLDVANRFVLVHNAAPDNFPLEGLREAFMDAAPTDPGWLDSHNDDRWADALADIGGWAKPIPEDVLATAEDDFGAVPPDAPARDARDDSKDHELTGHQRIAARFAEFALGKCLYVRGEGWHYWDGKRWAPDRDEARAHQVLQRLLRASWREARVGQPQLQRDVKSSSSGSGTRSVLRLAAREPALRTDEVDADPYKLNCANGTLDLHTFELAPHNPADRITKVTEAAYDPDAPSDSWDHFLGSSLPNQEVREYLQRYAGLSLIGRVISDLLVIATGDGRNGKGLFAYTLQFALGDYAVTATNDMLVRGRYGGKSAGELSAMMRLRGARWAVMSEMRKGDQLDEATMKSLTGGDIITAKRMGQDHIEFSPSHSFFMLTNDLPAVPDDAQAVWDRMRVIPFDVSFRGREDKTLRERLELQYDAALAWAVEGLRDYKQRGDQLAEPRAVLRRTEKYRSDNDPVSRFIEARCELEPSHKVRRSAFLTAYNDWARWHDDRVMNDQEMVPHMERRDGISIVAPKNVKHWKGVRLRSAAG